MVLFTVGVTLSSDSHFEVPIESLQVFWGDSRFILKWRPLCWSDYIHYKVCDEIIYPLPNFNGATVEVWEWISNLILHST